MCTDVSCHVSGCQAYAGSRLACTMRDAHIATARKCPLPVRCCKCRCLVKCLLSHLAKLQVRGKDFRHEKTKKKRGSYFGGKIDPGARHSFKYDSD
jgi:SRP40, C-terminal domain